MKEITKHRLKQVNRLLKIGLLTFCWLMASVGITAYSVYWLRQNANYEQEAYSRVLEPKRAIDIDNKRVAFSVYNDLAYYSVDRDINSVSDFLNFERQSVTEKSLSLQISVVDNSSFDNFSCDIVFNRFLRGDTQYFNLKIIYFASRLDNYVVASGDLVNTDNETLNTRVFDFTFNSYNIRYYTTGFSVLDFERFFSFLFEIKYTSDNITAFDFNNMLNYNRLFSYQIDNYNVFKYNGNTAITSQNITYYCNLTFVSNGVLFDKVEFNCSHIAYVSDNNGNTQTYSGYLSASTTDFYLTLTSISYRYYGTNTSIVVSSLGVLDYRTQYDGHNTSSTPVWLTLNGFNWINENYKYLSIYNGSLDNPTDSSLGNMLTGSSVPFLNLTSYQTLTFDYANNINSITDIGLSNVFTLMSNAFTGLASLMAINVIPGITLGLLAFVPFIVGIILIVIRLVKK